MPGLPPECRPNAEHIQLLQDVLACGHLDHASVRLFCCLLLEDLSAITSKKVLRSFSGVQRVKRRLAALDKAGLINFIERRKSLEIALKPRALFDEFCRRMDSNRSEKLFNLHGEPAWASR